MEIMVDYLAYYSPVLLRAVDICDGLIVFFSAQKASENNRFAQAASETKTERDGILERLGSSRYLTPREFDSSNINGFMAFYDNHATNDYGGSLPTEQPAVRDRLLVAWMAEVVEPLVQLMNQAEEQSC